MLASLPSGMRERVAGQCRQFEHDHPLPPKDVSLPVGWLPPRSETTMADGDKFYELTLTPVSPITINAIGPAVARWADCLVVLLRDVSSAKRLQQRIDAIDQAGSELVRFEADVVRKYNAVERLKLLEEKIVRFARDLLHFDHFAIRLLDETTGKLELVIGYGIRTDYDVCDIFARLDRKRHQRVRRGERQESYVCEDVTQDPLYLPGVVDAKSSLTVPLRIHDRVIGVMNVESQRAKAFGEDERQLGEIFARYIAVSLHMLDLLVVERSTVNLAVSGRVETELREPLEDIAHEIDILEHQHAQDPEDIAHLVRIKKDLASIRARLQQCMAGPAGLLGVEQAMQCTVDPAFVGKRVLVADDEARIRGIICGVLERRGAVVTCVETGTEAIGEIHKAGAVGFDMIVSDIRMEGANGYEVFAAARKEHAGVKVILMTGFGYDPHHSIVRASQEGLQSVLFKPFQVERLVEEVRKAMTK